MAAQDSAAQLALFHSRRGNKRKVGIARFPYRREELGMLKEPGRQPTSNMLDTSGLPWY